MGYRVGIQCFHTRESATDYVMSSVAPVIAPDGRFLRAEKINNDWFFEGSQVLLTFPECSFVSQFSLGSTLAASFVFLFLIMSLFKMLIYFLKHTGVKDAS